MANIDVVPKRSSSALVWWVLAVVLIVLVIWLFAGNASTATTGQWHPLIDIRETMTVVRAV
jgi:hypothetical protein